MKLSCSVMAHPVRKPWVDELVASLDLDDVPVAYDPTPPSSDPGERWANGRRAWEAHDPEADYHLVLQDDAVVAPDLVAGLEKALDRLGAYGFMSPYLGSPRTDQRAARQAIARAATGKKSWTATWSLNWGPAILAPVATIGEMLRWCSAPKRAEDNYDARVGRFYRDVLGLRCWYPYPSLVEHRDGPSLIGHGSRRVAHAVLDASALGVDWFAVPEGGLEPLISPEIRGIADLLPCKEAA